MNEAMEEWRRLNGMEIAKRRIYAAAYSALNGDEIIIDEENLGVDYSPKNELDRGLFNIVQELLYGTYSSKEFYSLAENPEFIKDFSEKAVEKYKDKLARYILNNKNVSKKEDIEYTLELKLSFGKDGLVPVVTQDSSTKEVLIMSFANRQAVEMTLETGMATYWSKSRNALWKKGETSGNDLKIDEVRINCKQNSLLYLVTPQGKGACHTKDEKGEYKKSCFYRRINGDLLESL